MILSNRLILAGSAAAALLNETSSLTVFAVFARSFYARNENSALICFGHATLPPGPLMALCAPWYEPHLPVLGSVLERRGNLLHGGGCSIELSACPTWKPPPFPDPVASHIVASLNQLGNLLPARMPGEGFAPLLPQILGGALPEHIQKPPAHAPEALLRQEALRGFIHVWSWLRAHSDSQSEQCEAGVHALLGLGPGLTPSGDDALGGILLALTALRRTALRDALRDRVLRRAATSTNIISRAHLEQAALGLGAEPMHGVINELMTGGSNLPNVLDQLGSIGHSSGWDAFTGIALAMTALSIAEA